MSENIEEIYEEEEEEEEEKEDDMYFQDNMINKIDDFVFISDWCAASNYSFLEELGIKKIISLGNESEFEFYVCHDGIEYMKIVISDSKDADISKYFSQARDFITDVTLIHCRKGISRSATILISYLMYKGLSYSEAFDKIKSSRSFIFPNEGFDRQLKSYNFIQDD